MRRLPSARLCSSSLLTLILVLSSCLLIFSTLSFADAADRIAGPIDSTQRVELERSLHPKALPKYDVGPVDPQTKFSYVTLLTSPSAAQQKALDDLMAEQQNPSSPNYHKWLTPAQYADQFGLSQNDIDKITAWLKAEGLQVLNVGGGRNSVAFSGTVAELQRAFGTEIRNYKVNGKEHFANSTPLMIPSSLHGIVTGVIGLHSFVPHPAHQGRGTGGRLNSRPAYYDGNFIFPNYLAPGDIETIYNTAPFYPSINGAGQTLAIIGQTDIYLADIVDFRSSTLGFSLPAISGCSSNASGVVTATACNTTYFKYMLPSGTTDPGTPYSCGDLSEADLDIELSGETAQSAQIIYVNSPFVYDSNCNVTSGGGVLAALVAAIGVSPVPHVISMSYGLCEAESTSSLETSLQQGNVEGATILIASGDRSSAGCDEDPPDNATNPPFSPAVGGLAVNYPASSPYVTAVGGTEISLANDSYPNPSSFWSTTPGATGGTALSYIPEIAWNDDEEFAQYCLDPASGDPFCTEGGSPAVTGWVSITSAATAQSDIWIAGGGGGASNCFTQANGVCQSGPQPTWQQGLSVPGAPAGERYVPDVSLMASANFPGYIFCTPESELESGGTSTSSCASGIAAALNNANYISVIGGTSAATPVFAGIVTLLNQKVGATGGSGNINPNLYYLAAYAPANTFNQVTTGDNNVYCDPGTPAGQPAAIVCPAAGVFGYQASNIDTAIGTGYNLVTGLGSVNAYNLATAWSTSKAQVFTLSVPAVFTVVNTPIAWTGTLTALNGYSSNVNLSCAQTAGPTETCSAAPSPEVPSSTGATFALTFGTSAAGIATAGIYTFDITGTGTDPATVTHSHTASVTVNTDVSVATPPATPPAANPGQSTTTSFSVTPVGGSTFTAPVTYTVSGLPAGVTYSFSPGTGQIGSGSLAATVTLTIQTVGPFTGAASGSARPVLRNQKAPSEKLRSQNQRLWLPLSLPLFGVVVVGLAGRGVPRRYKILGLCLTLAVTGFLVACGGGGSSTTTPPPTVTVAVNPAIVSTLYPNLTGAPAQTQQFTATVTPSTESQSVTWAVAGVTGGNTTVGMISSTGLYTAPAALPAPAAVTVTATSAAATTPGSATVDLQTPTPPNTYPVTVTYATTGSAQHTTTFNLTVLAD